MPDATSKGTVGLVGLGLVGQALGRRLRTLGWTTLGLDLQPAACARFAADGGQVAENLAAMAREARIVVLAVFDTAGVLQAVEGEAGLLARGGQVQCIIDCSTGDPVALQALAQRLQARGLHFIESPLSGSSQQIEAGEATALLGAGPDALTLAAPLLQDLASTRIHVGAAGMGARAKLATNLVLGLNRAVLAEGLVFAQSLGLDAARFLELVLATPARSDAAVVKGPLMVAEDFAPRSRIRQHLKDVHLMLEAAQAAGCALPFSQLHAELMEDAVQAGEGELDNAAILLALRRAARRPDAL